MEFLDHHDLIGQLEWPALIEELRDTFLRNEVTSPERHVHSIPLPDGSEASLLVMPAWEAGKLIGIKAVTFFPGNAAIGKPTINAGYMLFNGMDGHLAAVLDGDALTARRTAATSALAARYLARPDVRRLLIVGTGHLAVPVAEAHATVRPYTKISVWGRDGEKAAATAAALRGKGLTAMACPDLETGVRSADVISTVTASTMPLIKGKWLPEGVHLDLIGGFRADMRETDTDTVTGAEIFVDGRAGAQLAGDLAAPLSEGAIALEDIRADITELVRGDHPGRETPESRTLFKSVGLAAEDLAAARLALT